jgi:hypothetical protein
MTTTIYAGKITYYINGKASTAEASDVMNNGSFRYSRTDVNEAGTVTAPDKMYVHLSRPRHHVCLILNGMQSVPNGDEGFWRPHVLMGRRPTIRCQWYHGVPYRDRWSIPLPDRRGTADTSSRTARLRRSTRLRLLLRVGSLHVHR